MTPPDIIPGGNPDVLIGIQSTPLVEQIDEVPVPQEKQDGTPEIPKKKILWMDADFFYVLWLGLSFFLLISPFIAVQNVQSQVNADSGLLALGMLYTAFGFGSLFAGPVTQRVGERNTLVLGAVGYVAFLAANIKTNTVILCIAAAINGFGAAALWVAQGVYLNRLTTDVNRNLFNSVFVFFLGMSHIAGNALTRALQEIENFEFIILFIVATICCAIGGVAFMFLSPLPRASKENSPIGMYVVDILKLLVNKDMLPLLPMILGYGFNVSFVFGTFPSYIDDTKLSSLSLTAFGVFYLIISSSGTFIAKYLKGTCMGIVGASGILLGIVLSIIATDDTKWLFVVAGAVMGTFESGFLVQIHGIMGARFPDKLGHANSGMRFVSALGIAFILFLSIPLSFVAISIIVGVTQIVSVVLLLWTVLWSGKKQEYVFQLY